MATNDPRYNELEARCWQTQGELDRCAQDVERAMRFYDRVPDGGRRRPEATERMNHALDRKNAAEREAGRAADELIAYEAEHGTPEPVHQQLPLEHGIPNGPGDGHTGLPSN